MGVHWKGLVEEKIVSIVKLLSKLLYPGDLKLLEVRV